MTDLPAGLGWPGSIEHEEVHPGSPSGLGWPMADDGMHPQQNDNHRDAGSVSHD